MKKRNASEDNSRPSAPFERQFNTVSSVSTEQFPIYENAESRTPQQFNTVSSVHTEDFYIYEDPEPYTPQKRFFWTQLIVAFAVSMGLLLGGFTRGYSEPQFRISSLSKINADDLIEIDWAGKLSSLAAIFGSLLGPVSIYIGRRYILMGAGVPYFIGWIVIASVPNRHLAIAGQVLCGICAGVVASAVPVYIVETVQSEVRGALGLLPIVFRYSGALIIYYSGANLDKTVYIAAALSVLYMLLMFATSESPTFYIAKDRTYSARKALQWLRGKNYNIENEIQDLRLFQREADQTNVFKQMFHMRYISTVLISLGLMLFQQFSGKDVIYYGSRVMIQKSSGRAEVQSFTNILGITSVVSTFVAVVLIDLIGRKILLYISSGSMIASFVTLVSYVHIHDGTSDNTSVGWLPEACILLHMAGFSLGFGSIPWLMLGEILPLKIRVTATSFIVAIDLTLTYFAGTIFRNLINSDTVHTALLVLVVIRILEILFVKFCVPETRGKSLEEIEMNLTQGVKSINSKGRAVANANADFMRYLK
ncbi:hypothetical protein K1T71_010585 [Dendrolimus kikuchii]|uniref:Uncharacterized protein n=1 Tax=Dendrolimus kikuchii TaxID=765133 RepID=A0ACC1CPP6_9NEOP|nr:hypothetical protein K1T71_010585 [Dendrolimus kikuchii]